MAFKVGDEYRKNSLSLTPGGVTVIIKKRKKDGKIKHYEYDKVKYPKAFINYIRKADDGFISGHIKDENKNEE